MSGVFLSYSREDSKIIQQLEQALVGNGVSVWRDQEKIYGGEKWPKVLGEAIADRDVFLLAWSKYSSISHFVEFEWTTAIALKKTIVPCLLDTTPLPPSLTAIHGVPIDHLPELVAALTAAVPLEDVGRRMEVVRKLGEITGTKPEEVVRSARVIFDQRNWVVHGNVIQGEHVTVTIGQRADESPKGLLDKWQTWVALAVGVLTALSLVADLPGKLGFPIFSHEELVFEQPLAGSVRDENTNELLAGVDVTLPDLGLTVTTNPGGNFRFQVHGAKQDLVTVTAKKEGYVSSGPKNQILGNTKVLILLKKK